MRLRVAIARVLTGVTFTLFAGGFSAQAAAAKVCGLMPIADLEAHFGAKAGPPRGVDSPSVSICGVNVPDVRHHAGLTSQRPGPVAISTSQRLAAMKSLLDKQGSKTKNFGSVACFTGHEDIGGKNLPFTTCFTDEHGYISLEILSDNPNILVLPR